MHPWSPLSLGVLHSPDPVRLHPSVRPSAPTMHAPSKVHPSRYKTVLVGLTEDAPSPSSSTTSPSPVPLFIPPPCLLSLLTPSSPLLSPYPSPLSCLPALPLPFPRCCCRCIEEDGGLLDLEALPSFPNCLDLHKANNGEEPPFDVKVIFNTASLESEALKETLYRHAKTQVGGLPYKKREGRGIPIPLYN